MHSNPVLDCLFYHTLTLCGTGLGDVAAGECTLRIRTVSSWEATAYGSLVYRLLTRRDHTQRTTRTAMNNIKPAASNGPHGYISEYLILVMTINDLILQIGLPPRTTVVRLGRPPNTPMSSILLDWSHSVFRLVRPSNALMFSIWLR